MRKRHITKKKETRKLYRDLAGNIIRGKKDVKKSQEKVRNSFLRFILLIKQLSLEVLEKAYNDKYLTITKSDGDSTRDIVYFLSENRKLAIQEVIKLKKEEKDGIDSSLRNS